MKNKSNNIKYNSPLNSTSEFFIVSQKQTSSKGILNPFNISAISSFLQAFDMKFRVGKAKNAFLNSITELILIYGCLYSSMDSRFLRHIVGRSLTIHIPQFLYYFLMKVVIKTESRNKSLGWTHGNIEIFTPFDQVLTTIKKTFVESKNTDIFLETPFVAISYDERLYSEFSSLLDDKITKIEASLFDSDNNLNHFDIILDRFSRLPEILNRPDDLLIFHGKIGFDISPHLNIHRFRNSGDDLVYYVQQNTCLNLSSEAFNSFTVFLTIFLPTFYQGEYNDSSTHCLPGDSEINLSENHLKNCWEKFFSYTSVKGPAPSSFSNKEHFDTIDKNINSDISESDSDDILSAINSNSNCYSVSPDLKTVLLFTSTQKDKQDFYTYSFPADAFSEEALLFG